MRLLEILIVLLLVLCFLRPIFPAAWTWARFIPAASLLAVVLHLIFEGYRWQMLPLYLLALVLFLFSLYRFWQPAGDSHPAAWVTTLEVVGGLLLTAALAAPPLLFPILKPPAPAGPYAVGTFSIELTDAKRQELYSGKSGEPRRIMVQFWYPASPQPGTPTAPWTDHPEAVAPAGAAWLHLPSFALDHLKYAQTSSYLNAPLSAAKASYPVILFSHGWAGMRQQNTFQVQELASYGYVVAALDHPYGALVTVFPDGTVAKQNPDALPTDKPDSLLVPAAHKLVDQWAGDLSFVLDTLEQMNANDPQHGFTGKLDLDRIGAMGHSTGGGAIIEFCARDPRCKAGLGMDAYMIPVSDAARASGLHQPFLFLFSEKWPSAQNWQLFDQLDANSDSTVTAVIQGTSHYDFTDIPLFSPLSPQLGLKGPLPTGRVMRIIDAYSLAFFNQALLNQPSDLLTSPSTDYPEVKFRNSP